MPLLYRHDEIDNILVKVVPVSLEYVRSTSARVKEKIRQEWIATRLTQRKKTKN